MRIDKHAIGGILTIIIVMVLCIAIDVFSVIFISKYNFAKAGMTPTIATVTDADLSFIGRYGHSQKIVIEYEANGERYERELGSDMSVSFNAGAYGNYNAGDKVKIFYDPADPMTIIAERSMSVSIFSLVFASCALAFFTVILIVAIKASLKSKKIE